MTSLRILQFSMWMALAAGPVLAPAQSDNVALGPNFRFRDGLFLSFEQFQQNQPAFVWADIVGAMVSTKPGILKVESLRIGDAWESEELPLDSVWGVSRNGVPYVRIPRDTGDTRKFATFVALRMVGKICLYSYEREQDRKVVIRAYNPVTGRPFREGTITQKELVTEEKIIYFPTGETAALHPGVLAVWIEDDPELYQAFDNLGPRPTKEELYQTLVMYNERNRVYTFR